MVAGRDSVKGQSALKGAGGDAGIMCVWARSAGLGRVGGLKGCLSVGRVIKMARQGAPLVSCLARRLSGSTQNCGGSAGTRARLGCRYGCSAAGQHQRMVVMRWPSLTPAPLPSIWLNPSGSAGKARNGMRAGVRDQAWA